MNWTNIFKITDAESQISKKYIKNVLYGSILNTILDEKKKIFNAEQAKNEKLQIINKKLFEKIQQCMKFSEDGIVCETKTVEGQEVKKVSPGQLGLVIFRLLNETIEEVDAEIEKRKLQQEEEAEKRKLEQEKQDKLIAEAASFFDKYDVSDFWEKYDDKLTSVRQRDMEQQRMLEYEEAKRREAHEEAERAAYMRRYYDDQYIITYDPSTGEILEKNSEDIFGKQQSFESVSDLMKRLDLKIESYKKRL